MSFLFGHKAQPQYTGLSTQTSTSDVPITICMGKNRVAPNIIWQGDFQTHAGGAGKGLGGTEYTYSGSFQLGLCWGPINSVSASWNNGTWAGNFNPFTYFQGTSPQSAWGWLTTEHPDQALGYPYIAHLDVSNYNLGDNNTLDQFSFEVCGLLYNTAPWAQQTGGSITSDGEGNTIPTYTWTAGGDADCALCVQLYINSPLFGVVGGSQNEITLDNLLSTTAAATTGDSAYQTWCQAAGLGFSPVLTEQEPGTETLQRWMDLTNTALVWTGYSLKFIPYSTDTITGNGVTYLPNSSVVYSLTKNDYMVDGDNPPVKLNRVDPADAYNSVTITIKNRENSYNSLPVEWRDQSLIDQYGLLAQSDIEADEVCNSRIASIMVTLLGQRVAYTRNSYEFKVPPAYCLIEPMDILQVTDDALGTFYCRVTEVEEDDDDILTITANEFNQTVSSIGQMTATTSPAGNNANTGISPGSVNTPIIWEPPTSITGGTNQVWVAVSGGDGTTYNSAWGGCNVWLSTDGTTYEELTTKINAPARMGKLTAALPNFTGTNPDTADTLAVTVLESGATLTSASSSTDADNGVTQAYVDGEYLSYETATLSGTYTYNLTNLYRGQGDIASSAHASGVPFVRLDNAIFQYDLPVNYIGKTLYLKFQSFNTYGNAPQDISACTAYTYTPTGVSYGTGSGGVPSAPEGLSISVGSTSAVSTWTANSANDNVTAYLIYRAPGTGASFSSATQVGSTTTSIYTDASLAASTSYTEFIVAVNKVGNSLPSTGVNFTTDAGIPAVTTWSVTATGTGASQDITLPYSDLTVTDVFVFINGLGYFSHTISGDVLTMTSNATGDAITIVGITS